VGNKKGLGSAPGGPGIEPRWTRGPKLAVVTAYSASSRLWYRLDVVCVTEVYYPTIDTQQIRDYQFLHGCRWRRPRVGWVRSRLR
jgi:glucoamylase